MRYCQAERAGDRGRGDGAAPALAQPVESLSQKRRERDALLMHATLTEHRSDRREARAAEEKSDRGIGSAGDDLVEPSALTAVDGDGNLPRVECGKRALEISFEEIARGAFADALSHGECEDLHERERRHQSERARIAVGNGMEIERNPHVDHAGILRRQIEDQPARSAYFRNTAS